MSILEDLDKAAESRRSKGCIVKRNQDAHPEQSDEIELAMKSPYSAALISEVFKANGLDISPDSILRHRRRVCPCR